jgi:hypothetical protein
MLLGPGLQASVRRPAGLALGGQIRGAIGLGRWGSATGGRICHGMGLMGSETG